MPETAIIRFGLVTLAYDSIIWVVGYGQIGPGLMTLLNGRCAPQPAVQMLVLSALETAACDPKQPVAKLFTQFKVIPKSYIFSAILLAISQSAFSEPPHVSDCENPVYSLDQSDPKTELRLELGIMHYKECLIHVIDSGRPSETRRAELAMQRILLDQQKVWPLTKVIETAQTTGLWTENKAAAALSTQDEWGTHVYVILTRQDAESLVVDITPIEYRLLGKLGTLDRSQYERFETEPVEWLHVSDDHLLLNVRLRAWRDGQQQTIFGPVHINADGTVIWQ